MTKPHKIIARTVAGSSYETVLPDSILSQTNSVAYLRQQLATEYNLSLSTIQLIYKGQILQDDKSLSSYGIGSTITTTTTDNDEDNEYSSTTVLHVITRMRSVPATPTTPTVTTTVSSPSPAPANNTTNATSSSTLSSSTTTHPRK